MCCVIYEKAVGNISLPYCVINNETWLMFVLLAFFEERYLWKSEQRLIINHGSSMSASLSGGVSTSSGAYSNIIINTTGFGICCGNDSLRTALSPEPSFYIFYVRCELRIASDYIFMHEPASVLYLCENGALCNGPFLLYDQERVGSNASVMLPYEKLWMWLRYYRTNAIKNDLQMMHLYKLHSK